MEKKTVNASERQNNRAVQEQLLLQKKSKLGTYINTVNKDNKNEDKQSPLKSPSKRSQKDSLNTSITKASKLNKEVINYSNKKYQQSMSMQKMEDEQEKQVYNIQIDLNTTEFLYNLSKQRAEMDQHPLYNKFFKQIVDDKSNKSGGIKFQIKILSSLYKKPLFLQETRLYSDIKFPSFSVNYKKTIAFQIVSNQQEKEYFYLVFTVLTKNLDSNAYIERLVSSYSLGSVNKIINRCEQVLGYEGLKLQFDDMEKLTNELAKEENMFKEISARSKNPRRLSNFAVKVDFTYASCIEEKHKNGNPSVYQNVSVASSERNLFNAESTSKKSLLLSKKDQKQQIDNRIKQKQKESKNKILDVYGSIDNNKKRTSRLSQQNQIGSSNSIKDQSSILQKQLKKNAKKGKSPLKDVKRQYQISPPKRLINKKQSIDFQVMQKVNYQKKIDKSDIKISCIALDNFDESLGDLVVDIGIFGPTGNVTNQKGEVLEKLMDNIFDNDQSDNKCEIDIDFNLGVSENFLKLRDPHNYDKYNVVFFFSIDAEPEDDDDEEAGEKMYGWYAHPLFDENSKLNCGNFFTNIFTEEVGFDPYHYGAYNVQYEGLGHSIIQFTIGYPGQNIDELSKVSKIEKFEPLPKIVQKKNFHSDSEEEEDDDGEYSGEDGENGEKKKKNLLKKNEKKPEEKKEVIQKPGKGHIDIKLVQLSPFDESQGSISIDVFIFGRKGVLRDRANKAMYYINDRIFDSDKDDFILHIYQKQPININHADLQLASPKHFQDSRVIFIFSIDSEKDKKEAEFGWYPFFLFDQMGKPSLGTFSSQIYKPPVQSELPFDYTKLQKLDSEFQFEVSYEEKQLEVDNKKEIDIPANI